MEVDWHRELECWIERALERPDCEYMDVNGEAWRSWDEWKENAHTFTRSPKSLTFPLPWMETDEKK
jgi:hypothetical protein